MNKAYSCINDAVSDIEDNATIMVSGFSAGGTPANLIEGLIKKSPKNLTIIANTYSQFERLVEAGLVKKVICTYIAPPESEMAARSATVRQISEGKLETELVFNGTLQERIRAGGAGILAFYCPVGVGTLLEEDKEKKLINGQVGLLEYALTADFSLIRAEKADRWGNLVYNKAARNNAPIMAMAGKITIAEVEKIVDVGELDPEEIVTPSIFVDRLVQIQKTTATWHMHGLGAKSRILNE